MAGTPGDRFFTFMKKNLIVDLSFDFALDIIKLYQILVSQKEFQLSKQLLRSGTSIGANVEEANAGISKKDFINKMSIAAKEAREGWKEGSRNDRRDGK